MNKKELAEIKRRLNADKGNIPAILGCYVSREGEIIATFNDPMVSIPREEAARYMALFRRVLSGTPGVTQQDVVFSNEAVMDGDEHALLTALQGSALKDESAVRALYERVIRSLAMEDNYLILLAHDTYDVPRRKRDDERASGGLDAVFSYFVCCVCPVKLQKPVLRYCVPERDFRESLPEWAVGAPEAGFMFPAFDGRAANIYNALYYARDPEQAHPELTEALFGMGMPPAPAEQKETFNAVLKETLGEDMRFDAVQAVHEQLLDKLQQAQSGKSADAPEVSALDVAETLKGSGVAPERVDAFVQRYEEAFGRGVVLSAAALVDAKKFEVRTPSVVITVAPDCCDLVETRVMDGKRYILIRAEDAIQLNGADVTLNTREP